MRNRASLNFVFIQVFLLIVGLLVINYRTLVVSETMVVLFFVLEKWGKGIIFREIIALHTVLILLLMPLAGYNYYTIENSLARLWVKYMPVAEFEYFNFVFPATLVFIIVLCWPIHSLKRMDEGIPFIQRMRASIDRLKTSSVNPKALMVWSSGIYLVVPFLPAALQYIGYLFFTASFTGFLMLYLDVSAKYRKIYMGLFIAFLLYVAITSSMFTIIVYMGMTISSFLYLNLTLPFWKKLSWFILISFSVLALQNVKGAFRYYLSSNGNEQNSALYLGQLLVQEASRGYSGYSSDRFFLFYTRANQGFLVAKVMDYIPRKKELDNGAYLGEAIFSSLVPRIFWPDKPKAGGRFTMKYFTGEELVGTTSMNVSPVGEAYGSFGPVLGIVYMGVLALFIRGVYLYFITLTNTIPFLIFWFPVIFFQVTYSMETDSLQIFNSLVKSGVFVFIMYLISPTLFGVEKKSFLSLK